MRFRVHVLKSFLPLWLGFLFSFIFAPSAFASDPFTKTDAFKMYTKNNIFLYEPCDSEPPADDSSSTDKKLYTGTSNSVENTLFNASFGLNENVDNTYPVIQAGILEAIKAHLGVSNLETFSPSRGYLGWSSSDWNAFKSFVNSSDSDDYFGASRANIQEDLRSILTGSASSIEDKQKLIAAEFTYYYVKNKSAVNDGLFTCDGDYLAKSKCAGTNFLKKIDSSFSESSLDYDIESYKGRDVSRTGLTIELDPSSTSAYDFKSHALIIGDSLTFFANKSSNGSPISNVADAIDAAYNRKFEEGYDLISKHGSNFKYLIYQLGTNNCNGAGCTGSPENVDPEKVIERSREQFGANVYIFFITAYRPTETKSYDNYREITELNDKIKSFASDKVKIIDWAEELKKLSSDELKEYMENDGHPKEKGAQLLAKAYEKALSSAQTSAESATDTIACNRESRYTDATPTSEDDTPIDEGTDPADPTPPSGGDGGTGDTGGDTGGSTGLRDIPIKDYYNQNDGKWRSIKWKGGTTPTIKQSGCPMVSVINALYAQGYNVNPKGAAELMSKATNGFTKRLSKLFKNTADWGNLPEGIVYWYVNQAGASISNAGTTISQINSKLAAGYSIVLHGHRKDSVSTNCLGSTKGECIFTKGGHVIAIVGVKNGKWLVANPGNGGNRAISPSEVINSSYMTLNHAWAIKAK